MPIVPFMFLGLAFATLIIGGKVMWPTFALYCVAAIIAMISQIKYRGRYER